MLERCLILEILTLLASRLVSRSENEDGAEDEIRTLAKPTELIGFHASYWRIAV